MNVAIHLWESARTRRSGCADFASRIADSSSPVACGPLVLALAALLTIGSVATGDTTQQQQAVRDALASLAEDWNQRDEEALRGHWLPDGQYVDAAGSVHSARDFIAQSEATVPAGEGRPKLSIEVESIRLPTSEVALVDGRTALSDNSDQLLRQSRFSATLVFREGVWRLAQVHQLEVRSEMRPEPLEALSWLIGDWTGEQGESVTSTSAAWSEEGKFISREFEVTHAGGKVLSGSQKIGWDPRTRQIKSWFFDSDGTIGEGSWERHDEHWMVTVTGTLRDGKNVSATNVYTPIDDNSFLRRALHVRIGNHEMPDSEAVLVRVQP